MTTSKPRYLQIYEEIKKLIRNQTYKVGELLPPETELCKIHDASRPTVAKALSLLCSEKALKRRAGFGTVVLAPKVSELTAGLLLPQLAQTEIFEPICASISEHAARLGVRVVRPAELGFVQEPRVLAELLTESFIKARVNGVFFTPVEHISNQEAFNLNIIERLDAAGISVVLLDRDVYQWPRQTPFDLIGIDNIEAGFIVAGHLIGNGCQKLAFVSEANPAMTVQLRHIGVREAMIQNGFSSKALSSFEYDPEQPDKTLKGVVEAGTDGIVCANDVTAASLLRAMVDEGIHVPDTVKVCGFDDVKYASLLSVPLTSYQQPCEDIGKVALDTLIGRIKNPKSPNRRITLNGRLVPRKSSGG